MTLADNKQKKPYLAVFVALGFEARDAKDSGQVAGPCPFCRHTGEKGKVDYFYVNPETGQWDCKHCSEKGNLWTLLTRLTDHWTKHTTEGQYKELATKRIIPSEALRKQGWCNGMGRQWLLPVWNKEGTFVSQIYQWDETTNKVILLPGPTTHQLIGQTELAKAPKAAAVHICEGPWDAACLQHLLRAASRPDEYVVAVAGANVWKKEWTDLFSGKKVCLWYDHDKAGDDGSMKSGDALVKKASELLYVHWPETLKTGYDIRDYYKGVHVSKTPATEALSKLEQYLYPVHRRAKEFSPALKEAEAAKRGKPKVIPTFQKVLEVCGKWLKMNDDFKIALSVAMATCLANDIPGDPLWVYLVGPASSGKSVILTAIKDSVRVSFHSSVTAKTLVSGWSQNGTDPSLLPRLDGKTAVFKDGTELLEMRAENRREVYATLRGAYDGYVHREYAQGAIRDWKSHFNMLIGITNAIHGEQRAAMGERFLKLEMVQDVETVRAMTKAAILGESHEPQMERELSAVCVDFLEKTVDLVKLPKIPLEYVEKIAALAELVAALRAQVDREIYGDKDMRYKPVRENPTRIAKQLAKLGRMLCVVHDKGIVDRDVYLVIRKVAMDSCATFHLDVALGLCRKNRPMDINEMVQSLHLPATFLRNKLVDMEQLDIITKVKSPAGVKAGSLRANVSQWRIMDSIYDLWHRSKVFTNGQVRK